MSDKNNEAINYEKLREWLKNQVLLEFNNDLGGWPSVLYDCISNGTHDYLISIAKEYEPDWDQFRSIPH